jgi:hypothetical protein
MHHFISMIDSTTTRTIDDAVRQDATTFSIDRDCLAKIESVMKTLGDYPGVIGETVVEFRRAVALLRMRHNFGDEDSIVLASARVHEVWGTLGPVLERFASAAPQQSLRPGAASSGELQASH